MFSKMKLKTIGKELIPEIQSLTRQDFDVYTQTKTAYVSIQKTGRRGENGEWRRRTLDGNVEVFVFVPNHTNLYRNTDMNAHEWNEALGLGVNAEGMYVSEQEYKKFCEITKGFSDIETDSLTLQITLSNKKVLSLIKKWNEIADTSWACTSLQSPPHYFFERFEFLNLIPEVKPFSDEEIRFLIDNIKRSMIEAIKDL